MTVRQRFSGASDFGLRVLGFGVKGSRVRCCRLRGLSRSLGVASCPTFEDVGSSVCWVYGVGTLPPQAELDVRGVLAHQLAMINYFGNAILTPIFDPAAKNICEKFFWGTCGPEDEGAFYKSLHNFNKASPARLRHASQRN